MLLPVRGPAVRRVRRVRPSRAGVRGLLVAGPLLAVLVVAACSPGPERLQGQPASSTSPGSVRLAGLCPATVVVQSNWWPQAEDGALYRLLGGELTVDTGHKRVSGRLVADGADTGVRLEIRSGGPANGFVPAASTLYSDPEVLLGTADTDQVAQLAGRHRVKAVVAPLDRSPVVLMFDPAQHPDFTSIRQIGRTDTRVLYFQGATYMDYLTGAGILKKSQVDSGYTGTPDRWVASGGSIVQQGFLTNEPFAYQRELPAWRKTVGWLLVADTGYPVYPETLTVRADREARFAPCLHRLVPLIQRSIVGYLADPDATNRLIVRLANDFAAFPYSAERAAYAVRVMRRNKIVGNGSNETVGDFDPTRLRRLLEIVRPIFARAGQPLPAGLTADDLATNAYIDTSIRVR